MGRTQPNECNRAIQSSARVLVKKPASSVLAPLSISGKALDKCFFKDLAGFGQTVELFHSFGNGPALGLDV